MDRRSFIRDTMGTASGSILSKSCIASGKQSPSSITQVRIARTTDQLSEITAFYRDGLGLPVIGHFENHAGYTGIMFGTPTAAFHLEFTHASKGSPAASTNSDDLLVLYLADDRAYRERVQRLIDLGHSPVAPENPYWNDRSTVFVDPDGWHVVLHHGEAFVQRELEGVDGKALKVKAFPGE